MSDNYILCAFPETQYFMHHPRWNECMIAENMSDCHLIPEDLYEQYARGDLRFLIEAGQMECDLPDAKGRYLVSDRMSNETRDILMKKRQKADYNQIREHIKNHIPELYESLALDFPNPYSSQTWETNICYIISHSMKEYFIFKEPLLMSEYPED